MQSARRSLVCAATVAVLGVGLSLTVALPASATPKAPSWDDVRAAKSSTESTQRQVDVLGSRLGALQDAADRAAMAEQQAGQAYSLAASQQADAKAELTDLQAQSKRAKAKAKASAGQVAGLVVELSRAGGGDLTSSMLVDARDATDLLYQVGTMTHLSERSASVLAQAKNDQRTVDSLAAQADAATTALAKATKATKSAYTAANDAAASAQDRLATEQAQQQTVLDQLAYLKGTSASVEAAYWDGQRAKRAEAQLATQTTGGTRTSGGDAGGQASGSQSSNPRPSASSSGNGSGSGSGSGAGNSNPAPANPAPANPAPANPAPANPAPANPAPSKPAPTPTPTPAPSTPSYAGQAIAFARAQIGKPYVFGAAGPGSYDCSGLVLAAYGSVGVATGGHNVVWQYNYFASKGRLVPLSQRQPGDILFYSSNGSVSGAYHDSIVTGYGTMVEAARPGVGVVERAIWLPNQLLPYVARPTGAV